MKLFRLFRKRPTLADIVDVSTTCDENLTSAQRYERISGKLLDRDPKKWFEVKLAEYVFGIIMKEKPIILEDERDEFGERFVEAILGGIENIKITGTWEEFFPQLPSSVFQLAFHEHTQVFTDPPHPTCLFLRLSQGCLSGVFSVQTDDRWWQYLQFVKDASDNLTMEVRPRPAPDDLYNLRLQNPYEVLEALTHKYHFIEKFQQVMHEIQTQGTCHDKE